MVVNVGNMGGNTKKCVKSGWQCSESRWKLNYSDRNVTDNDTEEQWK